MRLRKLSEPNTLGGGGLPGQATLRRSRPRSVHPFVSDNRRLIGLTASILPFPAEE
jgi:hypothetical protein